jgi:hypothetical protein
MEEVRIASECEDAGTYIPCAGEVRLMPCPYDEDLHGDETLVLLCVCHAEVRARGL